MGEIAEDPSAGLCRMKAGYGAWLGAWNEGVATQPGSRSERVNLRFEVKSLDFHVLASSSTASLWLPEFSWSSYVSGLGSNPEDGLFELSPARRRARL